MARTIAPIKPLVINQMTREKVFDFCSSLSILTGTLRKATRISSQVFFYVFDLLSLSRLILQ